jgi:hypothetical protein
LDEQHDCQDSGVKDDHLFASACPELLLYYSLNGLDHSFVSSPDQFL